MRKLQYSHDPLMNGLQFHKSTGQGFDVRPSSVAEDTYHKVLSTIVTSETKLTTDILHTKWVYVTPLIQSVFTIFHL